MADARISNYRSMVGFLQKQDGTQLTMPPCRITVTPGFDRQFNMSPNQFGQDVPISHTDRGQTPTVTLTFGNGRAQPQVLEFIYLLNFESATSDVDFVSDLVVGARGQTLNETDGCYEISAAASGAEGNGMAADIMTAYEYDEVTDLAAEVTRETYAASGPVTADSYQQGADRALRVSTSLLGKTLKLYGVYNTTVTRLGDTDPGAYTIVAKAIRSEDGKVGIFRTERFVPQGNATHAPAAESLEITGTLEYTGIEGCRAPYDFLMPNRNVVCLNS